MVRMVVLALPALVLGAEVRFELPDPAVARSVLQGTIAISDPPAGVAKVDLPTVEGLEWQIAGSGSQTQIVNGAQTTTVQVRVAVRAEHTGTFAIPAIAIRLRDGSQLRTAPVTWQVGEGDPRLTGELHGEAVFAPSTIVPGESTTLTYRLWVRRGEVKTLGIAPPEGAISLGERTITQGRAYDAQGQEWTSVTVTWPLTFAAPGNHTVRGQQEVVIPVGDGFFDTRVVRRQAVIAPASLTVSALPDAGRPADFAGLIGPITATSAIERSRVSVGEGVVVAFTVSGRQVELVQRPELRLAGVQVYAKDEKSEAGSHTFRWDVVPTTAGTVTIPALAVPYFDPMGKAYRQAVAPALELQVLPGRTRDLGAVGALPAPGAPVASAPVPVALPTPRHGHASAPVPLWIAAVAGAMGVLVGAGAGLVARRPRRGPHRGRALRAAGHDPAAVAVALAALRPALTTDAQRAAAERLQAAVDAARFGGQALVLSEADLALVGAVP